MPCTSRPWLVATLLLTTTPAWSAPLPFFFVENRGQWPDEFRFGASDSQAVTMVSRRGLAAKFGDGTVIRIEAREGEAIGEQRLGGYASFILGNDPTRWRTRIPTFGAARIREIATGIDLILRERDGELELLLHTAAGVDPSSLRLNVSGADRIEVLPSGELAGCVTM